MRIVTKRQRLCYSDDCLLLLLSVSDQALQAWWQCCLEAECVIVHTLIESTHSVIIMTPRFGAIIISWLLWGSMGM